MTAGEETRGATPAPDVHAATAAQAARRLGVALDGLTAAEAAARLQHHGPNRLPGARPRSVLVRFLAQFRNILIYVLVGGGVITLAMAHFVDAGVIFAVVVINAVVGFIQEGRAERSLAAIRDMISPGAAVLRDGRRQSVPAADIVPGDVVLLEGGDRVPADLRIIRASALRIDEAALTGESVPVDKGSAPVAADAPLGDRTSMAFAGTFVAAGQGSGLVVATGADTELGRISTLVGTVETLETPLTRQMNVFGRLLTFVILGAVTVVGLVAVLWRDYAVEDAFLAMVGLAVSAIPEGLPAVMTIALAIGVERMARRRAIIRRLPAVETLGSVTVICTDKTGTLTRNEMMVAEAVTPERDYRVSGEGYAPEGMFAWGDSAEAVAHPQADPLLLGLARAGLLCNDAAVHPGEGGWRAAGDPMEAALVAFAGKVGLGEAARRDSPRRAEIPFDAAHRYMATVHDGAAAGTVFIKGAPERVVAMCAAERTSEGDRPLDAERWHRVVAGLAGRGRRVLALAEAPAGGDLSPAAIEGRAVLLGLVGLIDPPRAEALEAVAASRTAGIAVKMITGDHVATATAIAGELGLADRIEAMTGADIDALDDAALEAAAARATVFARASPEHKLRLVEALQRRREVVAMTGDGVNDAPALRRADIGVAMGQRGTEVAKETAEMVLADDNFASIVAAVREGRTVYDNLTKVIGWTLPTNGGEAAAIVAAILFGVALPLTPVQILWVNMVTSLALGLTLAFEPSEPGIMSRRPRRPGAPVLSRLLVWRIVFVSLLFTGGVFAAYGWAVGQGHSDAFARTLCVNVLVVMEAAYLFSVRYSYGPSITWRGALGTPAVLMGVAGAALAQAAFTYLPAAQRMFSTEPLGVPALAWAFGTGVVLLALVEAEKAVQRLLAGRRPADQAGRR